MPAKTKKNIWEFCDDQGTFTMEAPQDVARLYFPLCNEQGLMSSITPDLHGDVKTGQNYFLLQPVTEFDLHNSRTRRDFWLQVKNGEVISLAGEQGRQTAVILEAGLLYHRLTKNIKRLNMTAEITNFVPASGETVELMQVRIKNTGRKSFSFTPTCAIPVYGRSADNLRDHRQVTSLLQRVMVSRSAVTATPTMSFDERGHKLNKVSYVVQACDGQGNLPAGAFPTVAEFIGEGGDLEHPRSLLENLALPAKNGATRSGQEVMGALQYTPVTLKPSQEVSYIIIMGITSDPKDTKRWLNKFGSGDKFGKALKATREYWQQRLGQIIFSTDNKIFDNWMKWVQLQPILRKIYGNSFLPDHDYGRGGRGWRDLWQDLLALILIHPGEARSSLINNFAGVRIDGTNATIIGRNPGEFIADRNNITRVWMDHGTWPYLTLELYLHQTGDFEILLEETSFFRDPQLRRGQQKDENWSMEYGLKLKNQKGEIYWGSLLEHILVQHLVQFYNVGEHNHIRLEGADWNDGLDMAAERGESVAFSALYAGNLYRLADLLENLSQRRNIREVALARELLILLDTLSEPVNYQVISEKHKTLDHYFAAVTPGPEGEKSAVPIASLVKDLRAKADWISEHIRQNEWLAVKGGSTFFNGYYDNEGRRVEGDHAKGLRMTLTGQVFPIVGQVATDEQVAAIWMSIKKHLQDKTLGGFRLNTNFHELQLNLGRAFSFSYGDKENGAFFNHMSVMLAYGLYTRGFAAAGYEVVNSIFKMATDTEHSKIYPGVPEYFNASGRGLYHYLTGSASWLVLTMLEQVFGVGSRYGDLRLAPKFTPQQIKDLGQMSVQASFADKKIKVVYRNPRQLAHGQYAIKDIHLNGAKLNFTAPSPAEAVIKRADFQALASKEINLLEITLDK